MIYNVPYRSIMKIVDCRYFFQRVALFVQLVNHRDIPILQFCVTMLLAFVVNPKYWMECLVFWSAVHHSKFEE